VDDATPAAASVAPEQRLMVRITNSGRVSTAAMSPDGRLVVYAASEGEMESLWVKQIATGTTVRLTPPFTGNYLDVQVSPDGTYVYYTAFTREETNVANLFEIPILGGQPRRVATDTEYGFTLSPDGTRVAFRRYNAIDREHRLTVASVDGGGDQVVLRRKFPQFIHSMAWSPDGKRIAFVSPADAKEMRGAIFELVLETGRVEEIKTTPFGGMYSVSYMPDGSGFLAAAFHRDQPPQVWFIPRTGSNLRKITSDISSYSSIRVAADGKSLIAVRDEPDANVWVAEARDGRNMRALTSGVGNFFGMGGVTWLGHDKVIYTALLRGRSGLLAVDAGGGEPVALLRRMEGWEPAGSPDGKQIAFVSDAGGTTEVWVADASGENAKPISHDGHAGQPSFADGGRTLVYTNFGADQFSWRVDLASGTRQRLTNMPANRSTLSPDGKWLLARLRSREPAVPLWNTVVLPASGPGTGRSFKVPRYPGRPELRWLPDSKSFSFVDWKDGVANVWLQDLSAAEPRQITFFESGDIFAHAWSPDGTRLVLSRGTPMSDVVQIRDFL
jgi:Tol biopolymer transport system component